MISIILLGNVANDSMVTKSLEAIGNRADAEVILLADQRPAAASTSYKFVQTGDSTVSACLALAIGMSRGDTTLFIDARTSLTKDLLDSFLSSIDSSNGLTWSPVDTGSDSIDLEESSPEGLLRMLTNDSVAPTAMMAVRSNLLPKSEMPSGESATEMLTKLMIEIISAEENTSRAAGSVTAPREACLLTDSSRASCLKTLVNSANVEDLFPQHDWNTHEKESAAASYHTVAALFIRLGDSESAMDCLRVSDQLEDSPRSLALKGLIAIDRGEILGAVANMVSSLQQYELRKKENEIHYSRFQPQNLEVINENLNAGLQALNKRDNHRALNHFAEAVFNFDSFYGELGVNRVRG
jgi:hypothetical protein